MLPKEEIWPFISGFIIIGFILGSFLLVVGFRRAGHFLFLLLIFMIAFPFLQELLPSWVTLIFMAIIVLVFLRILATYILGKGAADTMIGSLAADLVRFFIRVALLPLQTVWWILRMINNSR